MSITIKNVSDYLEKIAPLNQAEDFDNVGLLIGNETTEVKGILVTLDTLEETIDEAIKKNCNLIISFHPIIFNGLKKINGNSYVERVVLKAIQNNIAIYATHTALDNSKIGVSAKMCEVLGLTNYSILLPKEDSSIGMEMIGFLET
jgi:dinuclear metal center YbgI/SA1388 family protein